MKKENSHIFRFFIKRGKTVSIITTRGYIYKYFMLVPEIILFVFSFTNNILFNIYAYTNYILKGKKSNKFSTHDDVL
jgi:hypothetical protein